MAIDTKNSEYEGAATKWQRARDAVAGQDAVHAGGERYLPKLKEQEPKEYESYKLRAGYYNATGRTLEGLVGLVFRKPPQIESAESMAGIIDDIDLQGTSLNNMAQHVLTDVLEVGRIGILVEHPSVLETPTTQAQAAAQNLRPYAAVYPTESIWDWKLERVNNVMQPVMVKLYEIFSEKVDAFTSDSGPQLRVLLLENGVYIQRLYRQQGEKKEWQQHGPDIIPLMGGKPLDFIPFYAFGPKANELQIQDAPILDLVDLNLAHYRVTADYENICHFSGCPTLLLAGLELAEGESVFVGGARAIVSPNHEAHGEYIEVKGDSQLLEKNLDRKERQMSSVGARFLEQQKNGVEAAETVKMRSNGESSVLASIANLVSRGLSQVLVFMQQWENGGNAEIKIDLNTDFVEAGLTPQELAETVKAWQSGAISFSTMFHVFKRGELIDGERSEEDELEAIKDGFEPVVSV